MTNASHHVAVLGASPKPERYANRAQRMLMEAGYSVVPVHPKIREIEGVPVTADRYSDRNFTYGLLHAAPLFTSVDLREFGGCFYDPTRPDAAARPSLPVAEDLNQRLISLHAFTDVARDSLEQVAAGMRKVMAHLDELAER